MALMYLWLTISAFVFVGSYKEFWIIEGTICFIIYILGLFTPVLAN